MTKDKPLSEKVEKCEVDEGGSENNYDWVYWEDVKEAVEKLKKEIEITAMKYGIIFPIGTETINNKIDKIFGELK